MDIKLQRYYEERFSMMASQGWKDLIEDVEEMLRATNSLDGIQDEKSLHFKRGEISIMKWLLSLKSSSEVAFKQLKDEDEIAP